MVTAVLLALAVFWCGCALVVLATAVLSRILPQVRALLLEPVRPRVARHPAPDRR